MGLYRNVVLTFCIVTLTTTFKLLVAQKSPFGNITRNTPLKRLKDSCLLPSDLKTRECCFTAKEWDLLGESERIPVSRCEFDKVTNSFPCAIRLGVNNWEGSFAAAYTAKIFIEEYLGWPVEIQAETVSDGVISSHDVVDEITGSVIEYGQWELIHQGYLDAVLEVWPSTHMKNEFKYVKKKGTVINAGALGLVGKVGWFFPRYLLNSSRPDVVGEPSGLEYWRNLKSNEHLFKDDKVNRPCCGSEPENTSLTCVASEIDGGPSVTVGGFKNGSVCDSNPDLSIPTTHAGRFLASNPVWVNLDAQILRALGLNFSLQYAHSEANLIKEMTNAIKNNQGLLMYFWKPHAAIRKLDLASVLLPQFDPSCFDSIGTNSYSCDFPQETLYKIFAKSIGDKYPDVAEFMNIFSFRSNADQEELMERVIYGPYSDWNEVTCEWLKQDIREFNETQSSLVALWKKVLDDKFRDVIWKGVQPLPVASVCECNSNNTRNVVQYFKFPESVQGVSFTEDVEVCSTGYSAGVYSTRWISRNYTTKVLQKVPCNYIHPDSMRGKVVLMFSLTACIIILLLGLSIYVYRNSQIMCASSKRTMAVFLTGAFCLNISSMFVLGSRSTSRCFFHISFVTFGAAWFVGSLLIKEFFLYRLFNPLSLNVDKTANMFRTRVMNHQFAILSMISLILIICWASIAGFAPKEDSIALHAFGISQEIIVFAPGGCPSDDTIMSVYGFLFLGLLLFSCTMAYYTRKIPGLYSEAYFVMMSCYNILVLFVAIAVVSRSVDISLPDNDLLLAAGFYLATIPSALMIVGTRTYVALKKISFDLHVEVTPDGKLRTSTTVKSKHKNNEIHTNQRNDPGLLKETGHMVHKHQIIAPNEIPKDIAPVSPSSSTHGLRHYFSVLSSKKSSQSGSRNHFSSEASDARSHDHTQRPRRKTSESLQGRDWNDHSFDNPSL